MTLVDAKHAKQHIEEVKPEGVVNEAVEQIAYADRIILNKVLYFLTSLLLLDGIGSAGSLCALFFILIIF